QAYGYYPGTFVTEIVIDTMQPTGTAVWPSRLRPFAGMSKDVFFCPAADEQCRWSETGPFTTSPYSPRARLASRFLDYGYDVAAIQRGGANVLFSDGHLAWNRQADMITQQPSDPQWKARRWNNDHAVHP